MHLSFFFVFYLVCFFTVLSNEECWVNYCVLYLLYGFPTSIFCCCRKISLVIQSQSCRCLVAAGAERWEHAEHIVKFSEGPRDKATGVAAWPSTERYTVVAVCTIRHVCCVFYAC